MTVRAVTLESVSLSVRAGVRSVIGSRASRCGPTHRCRVPVKFPSVLPQKNGLQECEECHRHLPAGWFCKNGDGRRAARCRTCRRGRNAHSSAKRRSVLAAAGAGAARRVTEADLRGIFKAHIEKHGYLCRCRPECEETLLNGYHFDHRIALARGGAHSVDNLRVMAPRCNLIKGSR